MVVKIYISGISGNKEVKKRQQRVLMILDSKNIKYEVIDITEPGRETDKDFMQNNSKSNGGTVSDPNPRSPLPPQMFNDEEYCGDYDQFDLANEVDTLEQFLKLEVSPEEPPQIESVKEKTLNGDLDGEKSKEESLEPDTDKANDTDQTEVKEDGNKSPVKENTPLREDGATLKEDGTTLKEDEATLKEATPTVDESNESAKPEKENEINVEKEASPERQKSIDKTESPENETTDEVNVKEASKESTPEKEEPINENGTVSSREQSEEKQAAVDETDVIERKKENPSELLIENEQAASAD